MSAYGSHSPFPALPHLLRNLLLLTSGILSGRLGSEILFLLKFQIVTEDVEAVVVDPPGDLEPLLYVGLLIVDLSPHHGAQLNEGPLQLPVLIVDLLLDPLYILDNFVNS